ncbi:MAG: hypothetical protein VB141_13825, partial [Burkholderia gladioli]
MAAADAAASSPVASDSSDTITRLQAAFKARGADIGVYPGIVNGTKLHDIVMSVNNEVPPTPAEIDAANVNISTWTLVNFQYDDMTGYIDTPEKQAAADQLYRDIRVYARQEYIKGNVVYFAGPLYSCVPKPKRIGADGWETINAYASLEQALGAGGDNFGHVIGGRAPAKEHMGADCQTPDAAAQAEYIESIVDPLVTNYKIALDT